MTDILSQVRHQLSMRQQIHVSNQLNETGKIDPDMLNGFISINRNKDLSQAKKDEFTDFMLAHPFKLNPEETIQSTNGDQVTITANFGDDYITNYKIVNKERIRHGNEKRASSNDDFKVTTYQDGKERNT